MEPGKAFVDLLDEVLCTPSSRVQVPGSGFSRSGFGIATHPIYWLDQRLSANGAVPKTDAPKAWPPPPSEKQPARVRRRLSPTHQRALDTLVELGARLDDTFTGDELRAAFRALALRYHPDRHPGSNRREASRLAGLFARAHDACEQLKAVSQVVIH